MTWTHGEVTRPTSPVIQSPEGELSEKVMGRRKRGKFLCDAKFWTQVLLCYVMGRRREAGREGREWGWNRYLEISALNSRGLLLMLAMVRGFLLVTAGGIL